MPDNKMSLEDILNEYSPENGGETPHVGRIDAQKAVNSVLKDPTHIEPEPETPKKPVSHEKNDLFDNASRSPRPADQVQPLDLSRKKVVIADNDGVKTVSAPKRKFEIPADQVSDEAPKIRRMENSTRAKEAQERAKEKRSLFSLFRKSRGSGYTYAKETPGGEYMYTPPEIKKKKRSRHDILSEAESDEGRRNMTDIVPAPREQEESTKPAEPEKKPVEQVEKPTEPEKKTAEQVKKSPEPEKSSQEQTAKVDDAEKTPKTEKKPPAEPAKKSPEAEKFPEKTEEKPAEPKSEETPEKPVTEPEVDVPIPEEKPETKEIPDDTPKTAPPRRRSGARGERTKRMVDFNYYGDVQDVGKDIADLKETITSRVMILAPTAFISLYITLCNSLGIPILSFLSREHTMSYLVAHLVLGLIAVAFSIPVITKGVKNLFTLKPDSDSMTAITAISCIIACISAFFSLDMAKAETIHIYMPVGIIALWFNAIGKQMILERASRNFKFISKEFDRHAVVYVKDEERAERLTRGTIGDFPILATMRKTESMTDFLRYSYSSDITDFFCRKAAPLTLIASVLVSLFITYFRMGTLASADAFAFGCSIYSLLICATSCVSLPFVANLPLEKVSRQTLANKGILLGYQSVDDLYDANSMLVSADKLFPQSSLKIGGIKVFSNTKLDEALLEAASLTFHAGSVMRSLFSDVVIPGKEDILYPIENFSCEENLGLCGWINNRRVLFGSRELMESHNIEGLPTKAQEAEYSADGEPMYLSVSGNLSAMFMVQIRGEREVKIWAQRLAKKRVFLIVKSVDPCITEERISQLLDIPKEMLRVIPKRLYEDFDIETRNCESISASMACTGKFSSMAQLILGIKTIHSSAIVGLIIQTVSILLGFVLCMLLIMSKAFESDYVFMSATAAAIYNLVFTGVNWLAVKIRKI
ncbi:MAG: hypothetical protein IIZ18_03515 [Ruminococcus sp.]|nr:hypothetical protein [Ruminococcus sp.]